MRVRVLDKIEMNRKKCKLMKWVPILIKFKLQFKLKENVGFVAESIK